MCEFCESEHLVKGTFYGADIKIHKCANETDLRKCQIVKYLGDSQYSVVIDDGLFAKGYLNINYCPMCGRDLRGNSEIDSQVFDLHGVKLKHKVISFSSYEQSKYGYIPTDCVPLRAENAMIVDMIVGYNSNNFGKIHLCTKCTKEFKKFMKKDT